MARRKKERAVTSKRFIALALSLGAVFAGLWGLLDSRGTPGDAGPFSVAGTCLLPGILEKESPCGPVKEGVAMAMTKDSVSPKTAMPSLDASPPAVTETATFALG